MKVRVLKSFAGVGPKGERVSHGMGEEFELEKGTDWIEAGLVEVIGEVEVVEFAVSEREHEKHETKRKARKTGA